MPDTTDGNQGQGEAVMVPPPKKNRSLCFVLCHGNHYVSFPGGGVARYALHVLSLDTLSRCSVRSQ